MEAIDLIPGNNYLFQGHVVKLIVVLDLKYVLAEYIMTGLKDRILLSSLGNVNQQLEGATSTDPLEILAVSDENWLRAQQRLKIIIPILNKRGDQALVNHVASLNNLGVATIYRWLRRYDLTGSVIGLIDKVRSGGKGKMRIPTAQEVIVDKAIESIYLNKQRKSVARVILEVQMQSKNLMLIPPAASTIRRRIQNLPAFDVARFRFGSKIAKEQFSPLLGSFPDADFPLSVVQIDHTLADIILVDETYRKVVGRPWLTLAIDVFSRCVVGFHLSFDTPGAVGTGACIAHAMLAKELWLSQANVNGDWDCWGVMRTIHLDNAKEFHGKMLRIACEKYGIKLEHRPKATPNFGGHIERLMGTFMQEVHTLKGTTFSNPRERIGYDSEKNASMTLSELENWLTEFIINVYHKRVHSGINMSPANKYREGIFGSANKPGSGVPKRLFNERQVRLDFMPIEERTIQGYGVLIDHIYYYDDILKQYIHSIDEGSGKSRVKRKFVFKRNPRDISCIYFYDQSTSQYHKIPYRDMSRPMMSIWEHREILKRLKEEGRQNVTENDIFRGYENMRKIELAAIETTRKISKSRNRILHGAVDAKFFVPETMADNVEPGLGIDQMPDTHFRKIDRKNIKPFEGLDND